MSEESRLFTEIGESVLTCGEKCWNTHGFYATQKCFAKDMDHGNSSDMVAVCVNGRVPLKPDGTPTNMS